MLGPVQTTRYDLRFRLFGIPVIVSPWFWLIGAVGASSSFEQGHFDLVLIWIGCLFVSILVHELGHALVAQSFGWPPTIILYQFGGLAVFQPGFGFNTSRSVLVSFAGPGAGFVLYGLVLLLERLIEPTTWFVTLDHGSQIRLADFFRQMEWINLGWGLVNLLPVLPLDGGRVAEALLVRARPWDGQRTAIIVSVVTAGAAALYFFTRKNEFGTFPAILFAILCFANIQSMQQREPW